MDILGTALARLPLEGDPGDSGLPRPAYDASQIRYREVATRWEHDDGIFWCWMAPAGRPSYTLEMMAEMTEVQRGIRRMFAESSGGAAPFQYFVCGSRTPGIYNLGGDLGHFVAQIRRGDLEAMRRYAHVCVDGQFEYYRAFGAPIITIALVQGDALGGGFEHAMAFDIVVAERSARMGLPEVLFNLFPGMGAYSFIARRIGARETERLIMSGKVYTAEELYELGLVDVLAEDGEGERALREHVAHTRRRFNMQRAVYEARRRVNPVTLEELRSVTDLWAETAMKLEERDLKVMERLTLAQDRRLATVRTPVRAV